MNPSYPGNQAVEHTSDEVHNFLEPNTKWVGYHPMGGSKFPGTTNVPHLNIIRDNGKVDNGQVIYFSPYTISLDYGRGKDICNVSERSIISWKQMHLAALNSIPVTEEDRAQYNAFANCIREEIREVALGMIEAVYMELCTTALATVKNISTTSGFRKLRASLNARVTELLLELESVTTKYCGGSALEESEEYKSAFHELKKLYDFKYILKAENLANQFMEKNNVVMRRQLNQKKRYTNFVTVIFGVKLTSLHKNSFMPMFTKYSADKEGNMAEESRRVELKCRDNIKNVFDVVYLSRTKSVVPAVKREAFLETKPTVRNDNVTHVQTPASLDPGHSVDVFKNMLLRRGNEYFEKLKECANSAEPVINKQVSINLVSYTDSEFAAMIDGIEKTSSAEETTLVVRNSYLAQRAKNIERAQGRLVALDLVDEKVASRTIRDAWDLSSIMETDEWCDYDTMVQWSDAEHITPSVGPVGDDDSEEDESEANKKQASTNTSVRKQQRSKKGNISSKSSFLY